MFAKILQKSDSHVDQINSDVIDIRAPSIVELQVGPEQVRSFERVGVNLKLVLLDGRTIVVENFFVKGDQGERSDLVLQDSEGVSWWGQYPEHWTGFQFAEIEDGTGGVIPMWLKAGLALLGLGALGGAAAGGGGGGSGSDGDTAPAPNHPAVVGGVRDGSVTEDTAVVAGQLETSGALTVSDPDAGQSQFRAGAGVPVGPALGHLIIDASGHWTYQVDNSLPQIQSLGEGQERTETFQVRTADGTPSEITVTIHGVNDAPVAVADFAQVKEAGLADGGNVAEAGVPEAVGNVLDNDHDVDIGDTLQVTGVETSGGTTGILGTALLGTYGTLTLAADGSYVYDLDNSRAATQGLASGQQATDTFAYTVSDGRDSVTQTLTITVVGTNDGPVIDAASDSDLAGSVTEAGGVANGTPGVASATGTVTAADVDVGDTQHWSVVGTPDATYGVFTIDAATGQWTYTLDDAKPATQALAAGETQDLSYTVQVMDSHGATDTKTVTITITGSNDVPVVTNGIGSATEDTAVDGSGHLTVQGTVANGQALTIADADHDQDTFDPATVAFGSNSLGTPGALGALVVNTDGTWTYSVNNSSPEVQALPVGGTLTETFTVKSADGTATSTVTVTLHGVNDAPVANDDTVSVLEDTTLSGNVILGGLVPGEQADTDVDGDVLSLVRFSVDGHTYTAGSTAILEGGLLTVNADGSYTFKPEPNWNGSVPGVTYTISDGHGGVAQADLTISVTPVNDAPVPVADAAVVKEAGVADGSNSPLAGTPAASGNVLTNDTDVDGDTLTVSDIAFGGTAGTVGTALQGTYGSLVINSDGSYTYTLDNTLPATQALASGQKATEAFTYTAFDGTVGVPATLTVTVTGTNDVPVIDAGSVVTGSVIEAGGVENTTAGVQTATGTLAADDADSDDDPSSLLWSLSTGGQSAAGTYGSLALDAHGSWTYTLDDTSAATQGLKPGDTRTETFTAVVTDAHGATATQVITVTVNGRNDAAAIAGTAAGAVTEDGGVLNATKGQATASGQVQVSDVDTGENHFETPQTSALSGTYGTFTFDTATGIWTYQLDNSRTATQLLAQGETATDTLTVTSLDGTASQDITVTITGSNDVPVVTNGVGSVTEDVDVTGGNLVTQGTLSITDVDHGQSSFDAGSVAFAGNSLGTSGALGSLAVNAAGAWTYTVDDSLGAVQSLALGQTITETFTVKSADGAATSTVTVTINGANDAPVNAVPDTSTTPLTTAEDTPLAVHGVSVSDVDGGLLTTTLTATQGTVSVTTGTGATVNDNGTGTVTITGSAAQVNAALAGLVFTNAPDYHGTAQIAVVTSDGSLSDTDTIAITVTPVADAVDDAITTNEDAAVVLDVLANDSFEGTGKHVTGINGAAIATGDTVAVANGRVTLDADGKLTFTPDANYHGTTSFTYTANTDTGVAETATATVTVNPVNDAPQGTDHSFTINEDTSHPFTAADFGFSDPVDGDAFKAVTITTLPTVGTLTLDGAAVTAGQSIAVGDLGDLVFTPTANANGAGYADFTFQVQDDGGMAFGGRDTDPTPNTITFNVTPINDPPVPVADAVAVKEAGVADGGNSPLAGTDQATGNVLANDTDVDGDTLTVSGIAFGGAAGTVGTALQGSYGSLVINSDGSYTYTLDNTLSATQALASGQQATEVFTYTAFDGTVGVPATLTVMVTGTNDVPVITSDAAAANGSVVEAGGVGNGTLGTATAAGTLTATDVDAGDTRHWSVTGSPDTTYGTFAIDAAMGQWTYTLDDAKAATQALTAGQTVDLTYTVQVADAHGATASQDVTITITGANDMPVLSGTATGAVVEAGGMSNAVLNHPDAQGTVHIEDPDAGQSSFQPPASLDGIYGRFTFDAATGGWSYLLDNSRPATQALTQGQQVTDTLAVTSADNTASQNIVVTITGSNDVPVVSNGTGSVTEDVDVTGGNLVTQGTLSIADADLNQSSFDTGSVAFAGNSLGASSALGSLAVNAAGAWTYTVDDSLSAVQSLALGQTITETFTVKSVDGTATSTVTVTINGANDAPYITSTAAAAEGSVVEAGVDGTGHAIGTATATGTLTGDDIDSDDDPASLRWSLQSGGQSAVGTYGSLVLNATTGKWTYTLDDTKAATQELKAGEAPIETFTAVVTDSHGATATQVITVNVDGSNDAPTVVGTVPDQANPDATAAINLDLSGKFTDVDGDTLTYTASGLPTGLGIDSATGVITGTIDHSASQGAPDGKYSVTVTATDPSGAPTTQQFTWTVTNPAPIAHDDTVSGDEDTVITGNVITGSIGGGVPGVSGTVDSDPDGDTLSVLRFTVEGHTYAAGDSAAVTGGLLTLNADGSYTFTPDANWDGTAPAVTYTLTDGEGGLDTARLNITVTPVNDAPDAADKTLTMAEDGTHTFVASDFGFSDPVDGNGLQDVVIASLPTAGALTLDGVAVTAGQSIAAADLAAGKLVFTPAADANGTNYADFTFQVQDDGGTANGGVDTSASHTVTINVTPVQDVADDAVTTNEDTSVTLDVLANDSFAGLNKAVTAINGATIHEGDTVNVAHGTVTLGADGKLTFTPDTNWNGQTSFTYTADSSTGTPETATATVTVNPVNDAPEGADKTITTNEDAPYTLTASAFGFSDPVESNAFKAVTITTLPTAGTLTLDGTAVTAGQSVDVAYLNAGKLVFTPAANANGTNYADFTFQVQDNGGMANGGQDTDQSPNKIIFDVTPVNDPPVLANDVASVKEAGVADGGNSPLAGTDQATGNVLTNDTDVDGDTLTVSGIAFGGTAGTVGTALQGTYGSLVINSDGSYTYTLDNTLAATQALASGQQATEVFTYTASDGKAGVPATLTVTVTGTNDAPTISGADAGNVAEDGVQTATGQLQQADVDVGDTHTWSVSSTSGTYGTLTVDQTGKWVYVLDNAAAQKIAAGKTVQDAITVQVADAAGATATQVVTVTITGQNDAPVIQGSSTLAGAVTETADTSNSGADHTATGHIDFTDVDTTPTGDTHTVQSITPQGAGYLGTLSTDPVNDTTGQVGWTFTVPDGALDHLAAGQVVTQLYDVAISDGHGGTAVTTVTITITGTNDAPVISTATSDLATTVTEIADGAAGENTFVHGEEGFIHFSVLDTLDTTHTVSVAPEGGGSGYVGSFTITPVDNVNDQVQWQFTVPDSVLDSWPAGKTVEQTYDITISDGHGGTATQTVVVTLVGTNDRPLPEDDLSLVKQGGTVTDDVLTNDQDVDDGDKARMKVVQVDGKNIDTSTPVDIVRDESTVGTVSMNADGTLNFAAAAGFTGHVDVPYTVDDGSSGTSNARATANWAINVVGLDIVDNASVADPNVGDGVLASIDDLQHVKISGQVPEGGTLTSLTVTDGTNVVTVPLGSVTVNPDGSFTTAADLSGLKDGTLTVTMGVEDSSGATATVDDTIQKDTVTTVTIDPVTVVDGAIPTITGSGEPGDTIVLTINGTPVTLPQTVGSDGTWSYTPSAALDPTELTLQAGATDPWGNTKGDDRKVAGLAIEDQVAGNAADVLVYEAGLSTGSQHSDTTDYPTQVASTFTIDTSEGAVEHLVIGGTVTDGKVSGGTEVTIAQLQDVTTTAIAPIATAYGTLTITGYDESTGAVSFIYAITAPQTASGNAPADESADILDETIQIAVVDHDGDTRVRHIVAGVQDDVPTAVDEASVSLSEGKVTVGWNGSAWTAGTQNLLDNDTQGADGAKVYQVTYKNRDGDPQIATIGEHQDHISVDTQYGSLTVSSDGKWAYTSVESADHVKPDDDTEVRDDFSYTLVDGDGDISHPATQPIVVTDTVPHVGTPDAATVYEASLPLGSTPGDTNRPVQANGLLGVTPSKDTEDTTFSADSDPTDPTTSVGYLKSLGLESGGAALQYVISNEGHTLTAYNSGTHDSGHQIFTVDITDPKGSSPGYTFTLTGSLDQGGDPSTLMNIPFTVTDSDGDSDGGTIDITVMDDAPTGSINLSVDEDKVGGLTFNTTADSTPGNTGVSQGGTALTGVPNGNGGKDYTTTNGTVTVNADGTITYTPDHNFSGSESFTFTTADGTTRIVDMTVNPVSDAPTLSDAASINTLEDTAVALGLQAPVITDDGSGIGNNPTSERVGAITLSGFPDGAVLQDGSGNVLHTFTSADGGKVTVVLTDTGLSVTGTTGTLTMTAAEFAALKVLPPANSSSNFTVNMDVTSYEVDGSGNVAQVGGTPVAGATSTTSAHVYVEAVTDDASLVFDTSKVSGVENVVGAISYDVFAGFPRAILAINEDTTFNAKDILASSFQDLDGSEVRSITIENFTGLPIEVNGTVVAFNGSITVPANSGAAGQTGDIGSFPDIRIGGVGNYSGKLDNIHITVNAQDKDADGYWNGSAVVPGTVNGVAEANTSNNLVTLNLRVNPVAGDVALSNVETNEDRAVAFLAGVHVTDSDGFGTEQIGVVSFTAPIDWGLVQAPAGGNLTGDGWAMTHTGAGTAGDPYVYTITFNNDGTSGATVLSEVQRETVLDGFTIKPPAQSSLDATFNVSITSTDTNTMGGAPAIPVSDTKTVTLPLTIQVDPVAEVIAPVGDPISDTDGDGQPDLTMMPSHDYAISGAEDTWFDLNADGGFKLETGWNDEDTSEQVYALLTPVLINGDGSNANAIGSQFQWTDASGEHTVTFTGEAIQVPVTSLDSLQFKAAPNFSGMFQINVQAYTVDADENNTGVTDTAVSGSAELTNVLVKPVADAVTLALSARASGLEDTPIPLAIHPTSSDPSETFIVTIANIPVGATLVYGSLSGEHISFTATEGHTTWTIPDSSQPGDTGTGFNEYFNSSTPLTIQAPLNSNESFTLNVSARSVDALTVDEHGVSTTYTDTSASSQPLAIDVAVKGVPDPVDLTTASPTYTEADLDGGTKQIHLQDIITSVALTDIDGSEVFTLRVSGLPDGFSLSGGTLLQPASGEPVPTGVGRTWVVTASQLADAVITGPENYSGVVSFVVAPVTTENDGASTVWGSTVVSFEVDPSPEATTTTSAQLTEDTLSNIGLVVVHHNGDNDETLTSVRIPVDDAATSKFTLYLDDGTDHPPTLAQALSAGTITSMTDGVVTYYVLTGDQAGQLLAQGANQLDGDLDGFDFQYEINDSHYGTVSSPDSVTTGWQDAHFDLNATPVTDGPTASITAITGLLVSTTEADDHSGDKATPDTATLGAPDAVTVNVNVASPDEDGSEHLIRVVIAGVPAGVTVEGGQYVADPADPGDPSKGNWILVYAGANALAIGGGAGGDLSLPITFNVSSQAGGLDNQAITITTQVQDRGNVAGETAEILTDSVTWNLSTTYTTEGGGAAAIGTWEYNDGSSGTPTFQATEDTPFTLSQAISAAVTVNSTGVNVFTVTLQNLPAGTVVSGMTQTTVTDAQGPHTVWTASATSVDGMSESDIAQMLQTLMKGITVTPPPNSNDNNAPDAFQFDAQLTTSLVGGGTESAAINAPDLVIPVTPATDPATISIGLDTSVDTNGLNESDTRIPITLTVSDAADGTYGTLSDGKVYLQVASGEAGLQGGTLTVDGTNYTPTSVTGVNGVPDGDYYVVSDVTMGETLKLVYTPVIPAGQVMTPGSVTVTAYTHNQEANSAEATNGTPLPSEGTGTLTVAVSNDGVVVASTASSGSEAAGVGVNATRVPLDLSVTLNDNDGSEKIDSILLSGVPNGFLVVTGSDAAHATLASNAGGLGNTNTWVVSATDGSLPAYVAIVPPQHWSGTLSDLELSVQSGETELPDKLTQGFDLADVTVTPVADGLTLLPTSTFGKEGSIIPLNLNASMQDSTNATTGSATDSSTESTSLTVTGLGAHAAFYLGSGLIDGSLTTDGSSDSGYPSHTVSVAYDSGTDAYTITGLSQYDLDQLGFVQANVALTDQDSAVDGTQLQVEAWTVESGDPTHPSAPASADITVNMTTQLATSGNDNLIWTGDSIDARSGTDTVDLRYGESLSGQQLSGVSATDGSLSRAVLTHVETLDMSVAGANSITGLTPEQVQAILGTGPNASPTHQLTIDGSAADSLELSNQAQVGGAGPYSTWSYDSGTHVATGTIYDGLGNATGTVTVAVTGGVGVTMDGVVQQSVAPFSLGLESLSEAPQTDESAFLFQPEATAPTLDSVVAPEAGTPTQGSVTSFLPAAQTPPAGSTSPVAGDSTGSSASGSASDPGVTDVSVPLVPRLDDELQHSHPGVVALS